jgi:hypothetical protein
MALPTFRELWTTLQTPTNQQTKKLAMCWIMTCYNSNRETWPVISEVIGFVGYFGIATVLNAGEIQGFRCGLPGLFRLLSYYAA